MNHPDPKKHLHISLIKSSFRIAGCMVLTVNIVGPILAYDINRVLISINFANIMSFWFLF